MALRLVSYATCPYVQRARIALEYKAVAYDIDFIDLWKPPDWFAAVSPRGRVPVLLADGVSLFESAAIVEYLEERFPNPPLLPRKLEERARDRAWFGMITEDLFGPLHELGDASEEKEAAESGERLLEGLRILENAIAGRNWLSGDGGAFGFADVGAAPGLHRLDILERNDLWRLPPEHGGLKAWIRRVTALRAVKASVGEDFERRYIDGLGAGLTEREG
jgi:glutathione S-transferase